MNMKITQTITCAICLCLLVCRLAGAQATNTTSAATNFVNIGGRQLQLAIFGQGTPGVIVEAGLSDPVVESGSWKSVIDEVEKTTRICIYDRAGLGKSDAVTNVSRTSLDFVNDLHTLLVNAKVPPPYILVGHSIGGFTVRLYASKYPGEVAGAVLVDSSIPDQWSRCLAILPPESPQEPEGITKTRSFFKQKIDSQNPHSVSERLNFTASSAEVSTAGDLGNKPLIVISHSHNWRSFPDLPKNVSDKIEQSWDEWQNDLCRLSSNSTHKAAVKAGHYVQAEDPQLVVEAILKVVAATKQ
jgi:pimeloyl-ACP methyl ester carboxylesterase